MPDTRPSRTLPILYSFRRCPYAMRARLSIQASEYQCELREIVLRDKASALLDASPKGTVPVLVLPDSRVLDQSLDIMLYVLGEHDPHHWLPGDDTRSGIMALIAENDGPFKSHLDRTKYPDRFIAKGEQVDPEIERSRAMSFIHKLDHILSERSFIGGQKPNLADMAILPFVRQFAHIDIDRFRLEPLKMYPIGLRCSCLEDTSKQLWKNMINGKRGSNQFYFPQMLPRAILLKNPFEIL